MLRFIEGRARAGLPAFQFVMVYITEAHASDTWPMKFSVEWPRPTSLEQRVQYANTCASDLKLMKGFSEIVVDGMDDQFNAAFKSWPTAYYVVDSSGTLLYIGDASDDAPDEGEMYARYDVHELLEFLREWN